ncbi:hypothetical protein [Sediminicoccus rosea]|jgi:hypothetical protein|uniref:Uncharacterized protein n=1 Tax=Sediminicoccus rosea TaxID=1225128 RepID=A0ABZ0PHW5_9PROT|nr:hypothetical protein [Sediminicoccus rosea]WPB84876.1 hypothetical protein R9Z33_22630 [Sediminicoccus rosea]
MSPSRATLLAALGLALAQPALAQQGPIATPCAGNITIGPQLVRQQVAPDGSSAWAVLLGNARTHSIAVVVTASGFPPNLRTPSPERRMIVTAGTSNVPLLMVEAAAGVTAMPGNISLVLDQQAASGGPVIRVSNCSRW